MTTLAYGWLSDGLGGKRWQVMIIPAVSNILRLSYTETKLFSDANNYKQTLNFIGMVVVAVGPNYGATFFGYMINGASWGYWPLLFVSPVFQSKLLQVDSVYLF